MDDATRSAYKVFLDSPGGRYLIAHLLTLEASAQAEGRKSETVEGKALAMVKLNSAYDLRSHFDQMSRPVVRDASKIKNA